MTLGMWAPQPHQVVLSVVGVFWSVGFFGGEKGERGAYDRFDRLTFCTFLGGEMGTEFGGGRWVGGCEIGFFGFFG